MILNVRNDDNIWHKRAPMIGDNAEMSLEGIRWQRVD
jgi:hypothetical protein